MQKYRCTYCEYIYDPVSGDPEHNVGRYTPFDALPGDWVCPVCGVRGRTKTPKGIKEMKRL